MDTSGSFVGAGFDALPAHVAILDDDGTILYTNQSWDSFGDEQGVVAGAAGVGVNYLDVCDASAGDDAADAARGIRAVIAGKRETFSFEYPCHTPAEKHWFTMDATRYHHDGDRYVLVMHVEITERRLLEQQAREQADRMEAFATLLSHDLRNPLSVALATAQSLEDDTADSEDPDLASDDTTGQVLRSSLERMKTIIDDALVLATADDVEQPELVDLASAVEDAWSHVQTDDATISITDSVTMQADPALLEHLLENLFRNSVEHGSTSSQPQADDAVEHDSEAPTIEVGLLESAAGDQLSVDGFYVEDDGPGIPPADRDRIFESGYTTETAGTGFGLAIVKRVVDAHRWSITVTDGEDGGARFEIRTETSLESGASDRSSQ
ncbi:PAS domain-containing sensor histidine kinase [Natronorubrum thiooxidans]|uniref:histidine kinase n=1 Tax=Natronorubrum thiooxidans TaxID=308853 RepID=A0A1N7E800_9EURY|nr:PAS domain-containing sensor histidine kinase [Natronorubrum thiooxidans]SIR84159.1 His Kinase A (phospho-acceptor) domain-containing protein [Natronorubrum thiooxidans]